MDNKTTDKIHDHRIINIGTMGDDLGIAVEGFILDRKTQNLAPGTLEFYARTCDHFVRFCDGQQVKNVTQIDANLLRRFMLKIAEDHNPGGQHAIYRGVKAFLKWWGNEVEPEDWRNPIYKVKAPRVPLEPLEPAPMETISAMIGDCDNSLLGLRDKALLLFLLDSGTRAREALSVNLEDIDLFTGELIIKKGKGGKPRSVFMGKVTRKAVRAYLYRRQDHNPALWINKQNERLDYDGMRSAFRRRAAGAGVECPQIHGFRRAFAISMLRSQVDVFTIQKLMGHKDLQVLRRYLAQTDSDLKEAHNRASPGDILTKLK